MSRVVPAAADADADVERHVHPDRGPHLLAHERLQGLAGTAPVAALGVALAALLAAWLVVRGIGQRIEEYR